MAKVLYTWFAKLTLQVWLAAYVTLIVGRQALDDFHFHVQ